jgi:hypothetical protein
MLSLHQVATMWPREWLPNDQRPICLRRPNVGHLTMLLRFGSNPLHHRLWKRAQIQIVMRSRRDATNGAGAD